MISAKLTTLVFPNIKIFSIKSYNVMNSVYSVTSKILLRDSNYIVFVIWWPNLGNYQFYERHYQNLNFTRIWPKNSSFFEGYTWFKFNNLRLTLDMALKFYTSVAMIKTKSQRILATKFCRVYRGKNGRGHVAPFPHRE